jgi:hypothetical protein
MVPGPESKKASLAAIYRHVRSRTCAIPPGWPPFAVSQREDLDINKILFRTTLGEL